MLLLCSRSHALYNCSANIYMCLFTETCFQTCDHQTIRHETCKAQTYSNQSCPAAFFMSIKQWASHLLQTTCKVKPKLSSNFYKNVCRQSKASCIKQRDAFPLPRLRRILLTPIRRSQRCAYSLASDNLPCVQANSYFGLSVASKILPREKCFPHSSRLGSYYLIWYLCKSQSGKYLTHF